MMNWQKMPKTNEKAVNLTHGRNVLIILYYKKDKRISK